MAKKTLVTGAAGFIGSHLVEALVQSGHQVRVLVRYNGRDDRGHLDRLPASIMDHVEVHRGDLKDPEAVRKAVRGQEWVLHLGALIAIPYSYQNPLDVVQTNVLGTLTLLEASAQAGVGVFVNISTDKAANPISVLGYSKRIAERITAHFGKTVSSGKYMSVRFGNVLGSRGSVLMSFRDQIANGGPLTVTHRGVTRYFMTISEAVQLVIQAGAIGKSGEALVLDMGTPVSIYDVAKQLVTNSGKAIDIEIVGLRAGEKVHEELFGDGETDIRPAHPLISHVQVPSTSVADVPQTATDAKQLMIDLVASQ
jgi:FlaA1/EpsC-like NDP-sugar epimerase